MVRVARARKWLRSWGGTTCEGGRREVGKSAEGGLVASSVSAYFALTSGAGEESGGRVVKV